jgi:hypothetical protein
LITRQPDDQDWFVRPNFPHTTQQQ